ncbi:MAG: four helix bundle protein [Candidatus Abawacabacteria bacterium]|nr:four helix bundle protein [Candidatus Abawacabacteria bacterium]
MGTTPNVIQEKSFQFSIDILRFTKKLRVRHEYELASQLMRSGTSIGANIEEAIGAQSRKDFISKLAIARKEAREVNYWLALIKIYLPEESQTDKLLKNIDQLLAILTAIIKTSLSNS